MGVLYKLCYISNQVTDEDDTELTRLYQDLKREYFNGRSFENMFPSEKQKEQKPVAHENDFVSKPKTSLEILKHYLIWAENSEEDCPYTWKELAAAIKDAISALEQKPAEWSEEDEKMLENIRYALGYALVNNVIDEQTTDYVTTWLKSLRPSWKPIEEQLDAVRYVSQFDYGGHKAVLVSLYEQL